MYFQRVLSSRSAGKAELLSYIAAVGRSQSLGSTAIFVCVSLSNVGLLIIIQKVVLEKYVKYIQYFLEA